jgi:hypothetical protein
VEFSLENIRKDDDDRRHVVRKGRMVVWFIAKKEQPTYIYINFQNIIYY